MGIDPVTHSPRLDLLDLSSLLYNSSQMNMSRFLGVQNLVNPELLRIATSLISSQRESPNFFPQNLQQNQLCNPQILQNQINPQFVQHNEVLEEIQIVEPNVEQFPSDFTQLPTEWQSNGIMPLNFTEDDHYVNPDLPSYDYYGTSDQTLVEPSAENSAFYSNNSNQNFSFASVLSTPSSSPTPLNSNSTYINSATEDERESYCSNMLKFEIPDILCVNEFM